MEYFAFLKGKKIPKILYFSLFFSYCDYFFFLIPFYSFMTHCLLTPIVFRMHTHTQNF